MDEVVAIGHDVQVVDPDVRNYVYGLVTAVSLFPLCTFALPRLTEISSSEKMPTNTCWETMPWLAYAILNAG
jgi:hypothetical protein